MYIIKTVRNRKLSNGHTKSCEDSSHNSQRANHKYYFGMVKQNQNGLASKTDKITNELNT